MPPQTSAWPGWVDVLIVLGAIFVVSVLAFVWFAFFYKKKRKQKHRHRHHERRKKNPTLAETGGLPPIRGQENSPQP